MTPRERVQAALDHRTPDRTPIDLGGTCVSGISASAYSKLRVALGLPYQPVTMYEPLQILGLVEPEVRALLGIDTVPVLMPNTIFGYRNENWRPWKLFDGTDVLVPEGFVTSVDTNGDILIYPQGDASVPPSGRMPKDGYYFDAIIRQDPIDENDLRPEDWIDGYISVLPDEDLEFVRRQADDLHANTDLALVLWYGGGGLGDIASVPGLAMKHPKGIRDVAQWYMAPLLYPDYVKGIFELQTEIVMQNLKMIHQAVGDKIEAFGLTGTDFGTQNGPFISPDAYREFFKPHHTRMTRWIHQNTKWKVILHSCGAITEFLDDFVEAGIDAINPVQCSAAGMDPRTLKDRWGDKLTFWGGAIDTQQVLPFGTPDQVRAMTAERVKALGASGGLVAAAIHNIQQNTPVENIIAFFETVRSTPVR